MKQAAISRAPAYPGDLLDHLRAFSVLCSCLERGDRSAYTRAAAGLAIDVSVLRRRMQVLATFVGARLVAGRGSNLRLTEAGARVRQKANTALEATSDLAIVATEDAGPLRIACTGTIFTDVLPPALRAVRDVHPRVLFRVRRAGADASLALLVRGEIDVAVVRSAERPPGVAASRLGADRLWLGLSASSPLVMSRRLSMAVLAKQPLVGYASTSSTMRRIMAVLGPLGATPWMEVDGKASALAYVAAGLGIGFVSALSWQRPERAGVALRDVTSSFGAVSFWLAWREGEGLPPYQRRFLEEVGRVASLRQAAQGGSRRRPA